MDIIEKTPLSVFTEKAYLDYSMYVILDRALPHIADGLKPVQRRIIYAMSELALHFQAKHKKSARTVGDVLGKFHPHGDSACYEAMVLMAQPFSYRYPLIDGQGNWGSTDDPKSFAAMRYTEAKLSAYADILLQELPQGTVDWVDNFDATLQEPALLPAKLPNILLNGSTGIAVGMSADILPHNLAEVANACMHLLENADASLKDICAHILGPDFPTKAEIITPPSQIEAIYEQGYGSIRMRAIYSLQGQHIVIKALPYQVSGAKILEQIAQQMQQKKLPMIEDLRDESDHTNPVRLVLILRSSRVDVESILSHLFATTDLECSYRVNFNMIGLNGKPRVKGLLTVLKEWLQYRLATVKRRLMYRIQAISQRMHILEGFLIAFLSIDEVIRIIREEDHPKSLLMTTFSLSEIQVQAILDLKLRHLAKLEEIRLQAEKEVLTKEYNSLQSILASEASLKKFVKEEILAVRDAYQDARSSPLVERSSSQAMKEEDILPNEPITVILSEKGWVRAAKGHDVQGRESSYKAGDNFKMQINARTNHPILFFDSQGKVYNLPGHALPSLRGQGEPLQSKLNPEEGAHFQTLAYGHPTDWLLLANDAGYGFLAQVSDLYVKSRNGKTCMKLPENSQWLPPLSLQEKEDYQIACVSNAGRLLLFPISEVPVLTKGKGNRLLFISKDKEKKELLVDIQILGPKSSLVIHAGKRYFTLKPNDLGPYSGSRGKKGSYLPRGLRNVTRISVEEN